MKHFQKFNGIALVAVLAILVVLAIMASTFTVLMNIENKHNTNQKHCAWKTPAGHIAERSSSYFTQHP